MAKKEKKISINAQETVMKERFPAVAEEDWYGNTVVVRKRLPVVEFLQFVKDVTDGCFLDDGTYVPELRDFYERMYTLTYHANFNMPESGEKQWELVYGTNAYRFVLSLVDADQYSQLIRAIDEKIGHLLDTDVMATRAKMNDLLQAFDSMGDKFANIFGGISNEDLKNVLGAVSAGGLDESKVVSAYMEQMKQQ